MKESFIDLYKNQLVYDDIKITIIVDSNMIYWLSTNDLRAIINYDNMINIINNKLNDDEIKIFDELKKFIKVMPSNIHANDKYINEFGLHKILALDESENAEKFNSWLFKSLSSSIMKYNKIILENKYKYETDKINRQIKIEENTMNTLQCINEQNKGCIKKLIKIGNVNDIYNKNEINEMELLYVININNPLILKNYKKKLSDSKIYYCNKKYYETTLKKIKKMINSNHEINNFNCKKCCQIIPIKKIFNHSIKYHNIDNDETIFIELIIENYDLLKKIDYHYKYLKYKQKYLLIR